MSSAIRSLERGIVKNKCYTVDHNTKNFSAVWGKVHYTDKGFQKPKRKVRENFSKQELLMRLHYFRKMQKQKNAEETVTD